MENRTYRYECVFAQASFQFCGHIDDYLIKNVRQLGLIYFQTRFGKGRHLFRRYEAGHLVEERELSFAPSCLGYYVGLWRHWNRELNTFRRGKAEVTAVFTHPLLAFGKGFRRNVRTFFWQWDHFPDTSPKSRLFNAFARFYAPRCTVYRPLTHAIGKAVGLPDAKPLMLGVRPPSRFGDPQSNRLLLVGQLRKGQGVEDVLNFLSRTPGYALSLLGASANGFGEEIRRFLVDKKLEGRVHFPDRFVSDAELRDEAAKCLAALALYDTAANNLTHYADPGKVKSAIEMGLPVVMTRISEIVPFITRFHAGEVIDSVADLPVALSRIRRDPASYFAGCRAFAAHFDYRKYDLLDCRPSGDLVSYAHADETDNCAHDQRNDRGGLHPFATAREQALSDLCGIRVLAAEVSAELVRTVQHGERASIREVSAALVSSAKKQGWFVPYSERTRFGDLKSRRSGESEVYAGTDYGVLTKVKDPQAKQPIKGTCPEDWLYEHVVHNVLFPDTRYEFVGITEVVGSARLVLRQANIDALERPTDARIAADMACLGFVSDGRYSFGNEVLSVTDVSAASDNVLLGRNGKTYYIDPLIRLKRPAKEVLEWLVGDLSE